ncbi:hypothetical protein PACTADRAFT_77653 [Pachysolen tannophilus NRRL Y-2460]|uniref:Uncharacterized protein n=1 Tax=Pachysolen tannophilus NRRL Y-2460 TaxID=669874 RepID=A0A1E4TND4_PACTA|nr:hypothetical protein PACTADRAFT_77653 [Pachysolen tannophilus NRRL Y-2460]
MFIVSRTRLTQFKGVYRSKLPLWVLKFSTTTSRHINPVFPFDVTDELENEDLQAEKKKLEKEKKKLEKNNKNGENGGDGGDKNDNDKKQPFRNFCFKCLETSGITFASLVILGSAGLLYHKLYQVHVADKMYNAFNQGDPAFQLTMHQRSNNNGKDWVQRPQQELLDEIIRGDIIGRYFLVIGEKGTGKTSMILEAIRKINGENCTFLDAHADPELFRIRLGHALKFAYHEDYIGSLFSIRGPRDTTAILDIERAFNELEEVAVKRVKATGKPLILVINNAHLIRDDPDGNNLVELLQQKAENLSGAGLVTMIFNSDDYWLYERLKKLGTRLEVINVRDLNREQSVKAIKVARLRYFQQPISDELANKVYDLIGGRPQHLSHVAGHADMITSCHEIIDGEKTWLLNQCGLLGNNMDDDVMASGKFSSSAMLLMKELVDMDRERIRKEFWQGLLKRESSARNLQDTDRNKLLASSSEHVRHKLPELPLWRARQIMTRPDFIKKYDNLNIFAIDSHSRVRADSVPMMRAFHEVASQPGFDDLLERTVQRISDIESLGRTRELVAKDLLLGDIIVDGDGEVMKIDQYEGEFRDCSAENEDEIKMEDINKEANKKKWWNRRMQAFGHNYIPPEYFNRDISQIKENDGDPFLDISRAQDESDGFKNKDKEHENTREG